MRSVEPPSRHRANRWLTAGAGLALLAGLVTPAAASASTGPPSAAGPAPATAVPSTAAPSTAAPSAPGVVPDGEPITLITGDVVSTDGGAVTVTAAKRRDGREPNFAISSPPEKDPAKRRILVVPDDAAPLIASGAVDEGLFDITRLRAAGYGTKAAPIQVISTFAKSVAKSNLRGQADQLRGADVVRPLASVHGTALSVPVAQASSFWQDLRSGVATTPARTLNRGVTRLVLDRPVKALLDRSVPQVHAPEAWAAGFDGTGVKVAVLDTGIDADHPELAGQVIDSKSFVAGQTVADGHGHGTHVASTIAGTGAGRNGQYKGVAPGAKLLVGKVLSDQGNGSDSEVIAGIEWAAAQGARVISMSLGGPAPASEAQDLLSQTVDQLSASGTLFVIAAGNSGPDQSTIGSPGVAASALTVAAVDDEDQAADFSSRGPLPQTYQRVLKPDLAAPGVDIAAARAGGTTMGTPIDDLYTRASGTSMATPHVAGAAAILAQRHPDWTGAQLKDALVSTTDETDGNPFVRGTGRLNVATAIQATVTTRGSLDLGRSVETAAAPITKTLTYANSGTVPVELTLTAELKQAGGAAIPDGVLTAPTKVTVPAGGQYDAAFTLDIGKLAVGQYAGSLVATDAAGHQVRTSIGHVRAYETMKLLPMITGRNGEKCTPDASIQSCSYTGVTAMNLDDPTLSVSVRDASEPLLVKPGRYSVSANVHFTANGTTNVAVLTVPELVVAKNLGGFQMVNLSVAKAKQVKVSTERPQHLYGGTQLYQRQSGEYYYLNGWITGYNESGLWSIPAGQVTTGSMLLTTQLELGAVPVQGKTTGTDSLALHPRYTTHSAAEPKFAATVKNAPLVDVGPTLEPEEAAKLRGAIALAMPPFNVYTGQYAPDLEEEQEAALAAAGAIGVLVWNPDLAYRVPYAGGSFESRKLPVAGLPWEEGDELSRRSKAGPVGVNLTSVTQTPYQYSLKFYERDSIGSLQYSVKDSQLAQLPQEYHTNGAVQEYQWRYTLGKWGQAGELPDTAGSALLTLAPSVLQIAPAKLTLLVGPLQPGQTWTRWNRTDHTWPPATGEDSSFWTQGYRSSTLKPGTNPVEASFDGPQVPGAAVDHPLVNRLCSTCRQGDTLLVRPTLTLADPAALTDPDAGILPGTYQDGTLPFAAWLDPRDSLKLYAGSNELPMYQTSSLRYGLFDVPSTPATLKLVYERDGSDRPEFMRYGRAIRTEWTFTTRRATTDTTAGTSCPKLTPAPAGACGVQPLLQVRVKAALNQRNQAPRAGSVVDLTAYHESSTVTEKPLTSLTAWYSFDDGTTWKAAKVTGQGNARKASIPRAPAGATAVSLRIDAVDRAGSRVYHELPRAFGLTG
ncbi:subtilisin family serine protease [Kribbella amoyensis]|uniref:Subtilisin family serine protease n=1 Tax=Kribbella amoyensis TaxID=996641 RepID=A0A561BUE8_9ACTN|nr:S8 family peptidase [Kribbella amoyensis]TWD82413.1 subtilisin family serine protease [Kribbella amoyensis]